MTIWDKITIDILLILVNVLNMVVNYRKRNYKWACFSAFLVGDCLCLLIHRIYQLNLGL